MNTFQVVTEAMLESCCLGWIILFDDLTEVLTATEKAKVFYRVWEGSTLFWPSKIKSVKVFKCLNIIYMRVEK